jgi:hypothetical protein
MNQKPNPCCCSEMRNLWQHGPTGHIPTLVYFPYGVVDHIVDIGESTMQRRIIIMCRVESDIFYPSSFDLYDRLLNNKYIICKNCMENMRRRKCL